MPTDQTAAAFAALTTVPSLARIDFLGLRLHDLSGAEVARRAASAAWTGRRALVLNANAHMTMLARRHVWLASELNRAEIAFCDGAGVQFGIWLLTGHRPHRTTPPEWIDAFAGQLPPGSSVFWIGGTLGVVERAADAFAIRHGLRTAGTQQGFFDHRAGSDDNRRLVERINRASPDVVLVNMGMPLQERWLADHWPLLNARVGIAGGALVDHLAGTVKRPPRWVADLGLEWAVRLSREPKRLWRRYLLGLPPFAVAVLREKLRRRAAGVRAAG